ncbi:MAG TPA: AmmeMemoRadiSam system protein B [Candidatus Magasanikbacteria bacterium]|nr:AmmeMemoRadiSam system protein B [Candidatus Magasanikbacteria bacterium]
MKKVFIVNLILLPILLLSGIVFVNLCYKAPVFLDSREILAVADIKEVSADIISSQETILAEPFDLQIYEDFYNKIPSVPENLGEIKGGIVPHHLLAGHLPAAFFNNLKKQNPETVYLIGPDHYHAGSGKVLTTNLSWQTPYGILPANKKMVENLQNQGVATNGNKEIFAKEQSISALVSFVKKSLPDTQIVPLIFDYTVTTDTLEKVYEYLKNNVSDKSVVVASVDFSHYMTWPVANFHDEFTKQVIKNLDYTRANKLEIDSWGSIYVLTKYLSAKNFGKVAYELSSNSAQLIGIPWTKETTSHYSPYFVAGDAQKEKVGSLLVFGDMMLDRNVKNKIDQNGFDYILGNLAGQENRFFMGVDLIMANLEGPFADSRRATTKEIAFRFDPMLLPELKKYNFDLFGLANNHTLDMSKTGFDEAKKNLSAAGFDYFGTQYRVDNESLIIKQVGDYKIGFIGLNDTNSAIEKSAVKKLIDSAKTQDADRTIIFIHWGAEYKEISNTRQRELAHYFVDNGADIVIGHHPHVVQEMEIYNNHPIFYSLGNFVFDQYFSVPTQQGFAVGLIIKDKQLSVYVFPLQQKASAVSLMEYSIAEKYMTNWTKNSRLQNYQFNNFNLKINL